MTERKRILWANLSASIDAAEMAAEESTGKLEREGWQQQALWLRELRARRTAMGREPDDEVNATGDLDAAEKTGGSWCSIPGECTCDPRACRARGCDDEPAPDCPVGGNRVCPIPPACTCELVDSSRDELPDGGPCPLSGWVAPRPGDGCPVHGDDELAPDDTP